MIAKDIKDVVNDWPDDAQIRCVATDDLRLILFGVVPPQVTNENEVAPAKMTTPLNLSELGQRIPLRGE